MVEKKPTLVGIEATGGLEAVAAMALAAAGVPVAVVNPRHVRDFAKATGRLAKTVAIDPEVLLFFAEAVRPEVRPLADAKQVKDVDSDIDRRLRQSSVWREKDDLLRSVPGVGRIISATLLVSLPELGRLDRRRIASLVGIAPLNRDSGTMRGHRSIWGGRASVRHMLYMAAVVGTRRDPIINALFVRLAAGTSACGSC